MNRDEENSNLENEGNHLIENDRLRINNRFELGKMAIKWFTILGSCIFILRYVFIGIGLLWISCTASCTKREREQKEYEIAYEECVLELGLQTCDSIIYYCKGECHMAIGTNSCVYNTKMSNDLKEKIDISFEKCILNLGIEKCNLIRKYNRHVH